MKLDLSTRTDYFVDMMEKILDPVPVPMILIDNETRIVMINQDFAAFLGSRQSEIIGKKVREVDPLSQFPQTFEKKNPEIARKHTFTNGNTAIVHRIPVLNDDNDVIYGFGMVLFQDMKEFNFLIKKNRLLEYESEQEGRHVNAIRGAKYSWDSIIGESEPMNQAVNMAKKTAQTTSNVLLHGSSGTGKEMFAHAIHNSSDRANQQFVKVNCAAIPSELVEAELFGYEEGAFTDAKKGGKIGKFEQANKGTIFLDEIGDMPISTQVKLLGVLQEREIERVGGNKVTPVDFRVITATNQNLSDLVEEGKFRIDLYYRLNVMSIMIPSLQERSGDILKMAYKLLNKLSDDLGKDVTHISQEACHLLEAYNWPGNVRELENVLERAINLTDSQTIDPSHFPYNLQRMNGKKEKKQGKLKEILAETEKGLVVNALEETNGNKLEAANILGISRSSLYDRLEKYDLAE